MTAPNLAAILRQRLANSAVPSSEIDRLATHLEVIDYPAGHCFVTQGERGDSAYLLVEGIVAVTHTFQEQEAEINRLRPGALFGVIALLDKERRSASCRAQGPVRAARIPHSAFAVSSAPNSPGASDDASAVLCLQHLLAQQLASDFENLDRRLREASAVRDWFASTDWAG